MSFLCCLAALSRHPRPCPTHQVSGDMCVHARSPKHHKLDILRSFEFFVCLRRGRTCGFFCRWLHHVESGGFQTFCNSFVARKRLKMCSEPLAWLEQDPFIVIVEIENACELSPPPTALSCAQPNKGKTTIKWGFFNLLRDVFVWKSSENVCDGAFFNHGSNATSVSCDGRKTSVAAGVCVIAQVSLETTIVLGINNKLCIFWWTTGSVVGRVHSVYVSSRDGNSAVHALCIIKLCVWNLHCQLSSVFGGGQRGNVAGRAHSMYKSVREAATVQYHRAGQSHMARLTFYSGVAQTTNRLGVTLCIHIRYIMMILICFIQVYTIAGKACGCYGQVPFFQ